MAESNHTNWKLRYEEYLPEQEGLREALCTLSNGYFATRGAAAESKADDVHYPGTYLAGGFNRLETEIHGRIISNEDLVNIPNWLCLAFRIEDGEWFNLKAVEIIDYFQELDLKDGVLYRTVKFRDAVGRVTVLKEKRFISMQHPHLAAIEWTLCSHGWSGKLEVMSALDGTVKNYGVKRYRDLNHEHLKPLDTEIDDQGFMFLKVICSQSEICIAQAARTRVLYGDQVFNKGQKNNVQKGYVSQHFFVDIRDGEPVTVQKTVALYTSKDLGISECGIEAKKTIYSVSSFEELLNSHIHALNALWSRFNIDIVMEEEYLKRHPLLILRLHIFHLFQTVSMNSIDIDVGVPARGLHGEAYRGHIFWDELFIFPILNLRMPEITRSLLMYRYHRLEEARRAAKECGYKGAMFPWQSGSNGREESQLVHLNPKSGRWVPDNSRIQRHVNVAIAYNIWRYYEATGNYEFLFTYGAEIILEITRFWASICEYNSEIDRYEIKGVMGPDEYHDGYPNSDIQGIDNNAYTNIMVAWVMLRAIEILHLIPESDCADLCSMLNIQPEEVKLWEEISTKMRVCYHGDGIISQFEGYEKLKEFDWSGYRKRYGDIQRLDRILEAEEDSANNYQVSKQADLLMLLYLFSYEELHEIFHMLGYPFDEDIIEKNVIYYMNRTSHGSTLSRVVHSWVFMRTRRAESWNLFLEALESDVADIQGGTTAEGIHLGAMSGTIDIIQRCYTGIETRNEVLWFKPHLPETLKSLALRIHYRGHSLKLHFTHETLRIASQHSIAKPIYIGVRGQIYKLLAGEVKEFETCLI